MQYTISARNVQRNLLFSEINQQIFPAPRWYQVESKPEWPRADYFKVRGMDEQEYLLKHDLESDEWYLGQKG
jgi:hypothetical protein